MDLSRGLGDVYKRQAEVCVGSLVLVADGPPVERYLRLLPPPGGRSSWCLDPSSLPPAHVERKINVDLRQKRLRDRVETKDTLTFLPLPLPSSFSFSISNPFSISFSSKIILKIDVRLDLLALMADAPVVPLPDIQTISSPLLPPSLDSGHPIPSHHRNRGSAHPRLHRPASSIASTLPLPLPLLPTCMPSIDFQISCQRLLPSTLYHGKGRDRIPLLSFRLCSRILTSHHHGWDETVEQELIQDRVLEGEGRAGVGTDTEMEMEMEMDTPPPASQLRSDLRVGVASDCTLTSIGSSHCCPSSHTSPPSSAPIASPGCCSSPPCRPERGRGEG
jgi:hypothetical protein